MAKVTTRLVYAVSTIVLQHAGQGVKINANEPWDADDDFVKANPIHFSAIPKTVRRFRGADQREQPIERATQRPGEPRVTGRPAGGDW
jgi:hypothetical protein